MRVIRYATSCLAAMMAYWLVACAAILLTPAVRDWIVGIGLVFTLLVVILLGREIVVTLRQ